MAKIQLNFSEIFLFFAGVALLLSLPLIADREYTLWTLSKTLYGIGLALFLFDR